MIRKLWADIYSFFASTVTGVWWNVLTWFGHGSFTFLATLLAERAGFAVASWYTLRELEQWLWGDLSPWWDRLGDVAAPWIAYFLALYLKNAAL